ncbi:hypothetical protein [Burkholderia sp. BDU5]|uniref:hypothetical protein n=1 Tax=Burkholderia sp. BDU5 TaxID=1385590 RepID=UPI0012E33A9F|nr:hypothetical protein [Burkholderia sp. BDU5]
MTSKLTADARATIMDACASISRSADELKAGCTTTDGEWPDADDKVLYEAELRLLERLVALLDNPVQQPNYCGAQRHSWATTGMKIDPEGHWVIASHVMVQQPSDECPHGVDDGACKHCYQEATKPSGEVTGEKTTRLIKTLSDIIHDQTVAMQSAIIEWQHGKGAEEGLNWIVNTLEGPGHLPDFDAPHGKHAQFWFNANQANPLPACFCGNPSSSLWMGQGFCCDEHYRKARANADAARTQGSRT